MDSTTTPRSQDILADAVSESQARSIVELLGRLYGVASIYPLMHPRVQSAGKELGDALAGPLQSSGSLRIGVVQGEVTIDGHVVPLEGGAERLFRNLDLLAIDGVELQAGVDERQLVELVSCIQQAIRDSALDRWDIQSWLTTLPAHATCLARQYAHLGRSGAPKSLDRTTRRRLIRDSLKPMQGIVLDRTAESMLQRFLESVFDSAGRHVDQAERSQGGMTEEEREDLFAHMVSAVQQILRQKVEDGVESLQLDEFFDDCMQTLAGQCGEDTAQSLIEPLRSQARGVLMGAFSNEIPIVAARQNGRVERRTVLVDDLLDGLQRFLAEPHPQVQFHGQAGWEKVCVVLEYLRAEPKGQGLRQRLRESLDELSPEERQEDLLQVARRLCQDQEMAALDVLLSCLAARSRGDGSPCHRRLLRRLVEEGGVAPARIWPHLVMAVLFEINAEMAERRWMVERMEQVPASLQATERHRLVELLGRRGVDRALVDVPTRELAMVPSFECILEHPMLTQAHESLIRALISQPPPIRIAPAFQAVDAQDPAGRRFVAAALREGGEETVSASLSQTGTKMLVQSLRQLPEEQRGLARALTLIDALGCVGGEKAEQALQEIQAERRGLFKAWPRAARRMAEQAMQRIRRGRS